MNGVARALVRADATRADLKLGDARVRADLDAELRADDVRAGSRSARIAKSFVEAKKVEVRRGTKRTSGWARLDVRALAVEHGGLGAASADLDARVADVAALLAAPTARATIALRSGAAHAKVHLERAAQPAR